jgi:C-terminal processing protease CtpA/Prc
MASSPWKNCFCSQLHKRPAGHRCSLPSASGTPTARRLATSATVRRTAFIPMTSDPIFRTTKALKRMVNANADASDQPLSEEQTNSRTDCFSVKLSKPLGLVLEMNEATGNVTVVEIQPGGNAEKSGMILEGDVLVSTTGYTRTTEQVYGETTVRGGERIVRLTVRGESFDTVLAAIGSHPASIPVTLELRRPR